MEYTITKVPPPKKSWLTDIFVLSWFSVLIYWNISMCASTSLAPAPKQNTVKNFDSNVSTSYPLYVQNTNLYLLWSVDIWPSTIYCTKNSFGIILSKNPVIRHSFPFKTWIQSIYYRYILPRIDIFTWRDRSIFLELRRTHRNFVKEKIITSRLRDINSKHHRVLNKAKYDKPGTVFEKFLMSCLFWTFFFQVCFLNISFPVLSPFPCHYPGLSVLSWSSSLLTFFV